MRHDAQKSGREGRDYRAKQSQSNTTFDGFLDYPSLRMGPGGLDLTGGYSYNWSHAEYPEVSLSGLSSDLLAGNGVTTARTVQNIQDIQESRLISFFGRINYNINDN